MCTVGQRPVRCNTMSPALGPTLKPVQGKMVETDGSLVGGLLVLSLFTSTQVFQSVGEKENILIGINKCIILSLDNKSGFQCEIF